MKLRRTGFLLASMFLVAGLLGCGDEQASIMEEQAIAAFKELGGRVEVDNNNSAVRLDLKRTKITNADLVHLEALTKLQDLILFDTKITDAGMVHMIGLTNLRTLELSGTNITDAGLEYLKGLHNLQALYHNRTQVTIEGSKNFRQAMPNCHIYP